MKSATVGPCAAVHHCRFISQGWLRILETLLSNQKPLKPRLHLATCALSNHLESGILKHGKAAILWLLGMSVCFLCLHAVLGFVGDIWRHQFPSSSIGDEFKQKLTDLITQASKAFLFLYKTDLPLVIMPT